MQKYIRHILIALTAFAAVVVLNFALPRLMPGDPVYLLTGLDAETLSAEVYARYYSALGLDLPLAQQFAAYLKTSSAEVWATPTTTTRPWLPSLRNVCPRRCRRCCPPSCSPPS